MTDVRHVSVGALFFQSCTFVCQCSPVNLCPPLAVAPLLQLAAAAPGHGRQRGYWCCAPSGLQRRRSSRICSGTMAWQLLTTP